VDKGAQGGAHGRRLRQSSGRQCVAEQLAHARRPGTVYVATESDRRAPAFFYFSRFSNTHILTFELVIFMSQIHQIFHKDSWNHKKQHSFLAQLQIPKYCKLKFLEQNQN
jgi:hypothetical protein